MSRSSTCARHLLLGVVAVLALVGCEDLDGRGSNRKGNRLFRETRFIDAATLYENALAKVKDDKIEYNLGLAYARIFRAGSDDLVLLAEKTESVCSTIPGATPAKRSVCVKLDAAEEDRAYPACGNVTPDHCQKAYANVATLSTASKWLATQKTNIASCATGSRAAVDCMLAMMEWDPKRWEECSTTPDPVVVPEPPATDPKAPATAPPAATPKTPATAKTPTAKTPATDPKAPATTPPTPTTPSPPAPKPEVTPDLCQKAYGHLAELNAKKTGPDPEWLATQQDNIASCPKGDKAVVDCLSGMQVWDSKRFDECNRAADCPSSAVCKRDLEMCAIDNKILANLSAQHLTIWIVKQPPDDEIKATVKVLTGELTELEAGRDAAEVEANDARDQTTGKFRDKVAYESAMQRKTAFEEQVKIKKEEIEEARLKFTMRSLMTNLWMDSQQYDKASDFWSLELKARQNDFEAMSMLAGINLKSGNYRKSIEWYLTVADKVPEPQNKITAFSSVGNVAWSKLNSKTLPADEAAELADLGIGALQKASALAPKNLSFLRLQIALYNFRALTHGSSWAAAIDRASSQDLKGLLDVVSGKAKPSAPGTPKPPTPPPPPTSPSMSGGSAEKAGG